MENHEYIEIEIALITHLIDALGYCGEDEYEIVSKLATTKLDAIAKYKHPKFYYLQALIPQIDLKDYEVDQRFNDLMKRSSDGGVAEAQYEHACRIWEAGDRIAAMALYKKSAENGFPASQYCYGLGAYTGDGISENKVAGLHYIELAAGRLNVLALEFLIGLYQEESSASGKDKLKLYSKMLSWAEG